MSEILTIEEIAPYCNYGLKGSFFGRHDIVTALDYEYKIISSLNSGNCLISDFKPYLRPLSGLTIKILSKYYTQLMDSDLNRAIKDTLQYPRNQSYTYTKWLLSKHFDLFGLIKKDLAIDINTLKL